MPVIVGVILAGGLSRRMGGQDKCLLPFGDSTLIDVAIERARPQVESLLLSVNGDHERLAGRGVPQAADVAGEHAGPLAGILTAMAWCERHCPDAEWVLSMACDTPFFPLDLAVRLLQAALSEGAVISVAVSDGHLHPVFGLWHRSLEEDLRSALVDRGERKVQRWLRGHRWTAVAFAREEGGPDPFFNINSPGDLAVARSMGVSDSPGGAS
jgi:molybdopterin-guanine dinucleotide biosynthesis protein A